MTNATDKQKNFMISLGIDFDDDISIETAKYLINQKVGDKSAKTETIKPKDFGIAKKEYKPYDTSSYYVAYAKDIFVAMITKMDVPKEPGTYDMLMDKAIQLVKLAQNEFKN